MFLYLRRRGRQVCWRQISRDIPRCVFLVVSSTACPDRSCLPAVCTMKAHHCEWLWRTSERPPGTQCIRNWTYRTNRTYRTYVVLCAYVTSLAFSLISVPASAFETGQFFFAPSAWSRKVFSSMPGIFAVVSNSI